MNKTGYDMKIKMFFTGILIVICSLQLTAQTIYSNGTGGGLWSSSATWLGGTIPNVNSDVIIASGDSVYTEIGAACRSLTIYSEGIFSTSVDTVYVAESLTLEADAWFYNNSTKSRLPGYDYIIDPQSYVVHTGSGTVGDASNLEFGNLIIQRSVGTRPGGDLIVHGDLIINNAAYNTVFRGAQAVSGNVTHTVEGNVYINRGTFSGIDVGENSQTCIWNIQGNVYVTDLDNDTYQESRIGLFSSANAAGYAEINIGGDLILSGGRLQGGTSSSAGPGYGVFTIGGNFTMDINSNTATNTLGSVDIVFNGTTKQIADLDTRFHMGTVVNTTISSGSDVVFDLDTNRWSSTGGGDFVVNGSLELVGSSYLDGSQSFVLNPGGVLKIGSPDGITNSTAGNIQVSGARSFSPEAVYEYKSVTPQQLGDALPNPLFGFNINNINNIELDRVITVTGSLKVLKGDLLLNGNTVTLGSDAVLSETPGNTVTGENGKITITKELNAPEGVNAGGLGAMITSAANLGTTTVERFHYVPVGGGNQGIKRVYKISPAVNSGLNTQLRLYYDESELNGLTESNLIVFQSADGSNNPWIKLFGTANTAENYVETSGVDNLSFFTLADMNNPLPVENEEGNVPDEYALQQNYPNPFNPSTEIKFQVPQAGLVVLRIYDVLGNHLTELVNDFKPAGYYSVSFNASGLASGIYMYTLQSGNFISSRKMLLIK
jgi:hypothetical protein